MESRRSSSYLRRQELMRTLRVPTISEIKANLGLPLALTIFEESNEALKGDLGLTPYLQGPGGELWMSPSDLLIGKVCLKPPFTQKHIQALTHQGILDIGAEIEVKYWKEMELEKEEAVREKEEYLTRKFELEKSRLLSETLESEELKHTQQMEEMRISFENKINVLVWACHQQVQQVEEQMQIEIDSVNVLWQEKLDEEIRNTVDRITEQFLEKLRLQEQVMVKVYTKQIQTLKSKYKCATDFLRIKSKEMMLQLRHKLKCENIANLMYMLCKERRKCKDESDALEDYYKGIIRKHKIQIRKKANSVRRITRCKNRKQKQLQVREKCLVEILRQFQKFIYFALRASPTQGEFLLNIDRLIQFQLDDYCIDQNENKKISNIAKKAQEKVQSSSFQYATEEYLPVALASLSSDEEEFEESDVLPAFFFDEKMYVREDFRDMFSAGIEIDTKHPLWNRDVEELLKIFRAKTSHLQIGKIKSHHSSVRFHQDGLTHSVSSESILSKDHTVCTYSMKSPSPPSQITQPQPQFIDDEEEEIRKISLGGSIDYKEKDKKQKKLSVVSKGTLKEKTSASGPRKSQDVDIQPRMRANSATHSKLTLARDSIILHISCLERKSLQIIAKAAEEKANEEKEKASTSSKTEQREETICIKSIDEKESCVLSTANEDYVSTTGDVRSIKSLDIKSPSEAKGTSKLLLAQDSLELIKSTITLTGKKDSQSDTFEQGKRKSQLTFNPQVVVTKSAKETPRSSKQTKPSAKHKASKPATPKSKPAVKVVGSIKTKEHQQPVEEFTEERIKSLVNLMKDNPSLIGLFTKCSK